MHDISKSMVAEQAQNRLLVELQQPHKELRILTLCLQKAREDERHRIADELHDRGGKNLTGLNLNFQTI